METENQKEQIMSSAGIQSTDSGPNKKTIIIAIVAVLIVSILCVIAILVAGGMIKMPSLSFLNRDNRLGFAVNDFNSGNLNNALDKVNQVVSDRPNSVDALIAKATILAQKGSLEFREKEYGEQAIAVAESVLKIDPKNDEAWRIIGYANEIMQKYKEAHTAYEKSLILNPKNAATLSNNAHAYDLEGDIVKAENGYKNALDIDPLLDHAKMGLGRIYVRQGKLSDAQSIFASVIGTSKNSRVRAEAAYSAGSIASVLNNSSLAGKMFKEATVIDESYALGWYGLGKETFSQAISTSTQISNSDRSKLVEKSFYDITKAIQLNPKQSLAYYQLGLQLSAIGQKKDGLAILEKMVKIIPEDITMTAKEKDQMTSLVASAIKTISARK